MRFALFVQSLVSCWNHGNAHFLRGVMRELQAAGHEAVAFEPANGWSRTHLRATAGIEAEERFHHTFPTLESHPYERASFDVDRALDGADVVLVHEWNEPWLVEALGRRRRRGGRFVLLFHDTHHRAVTAPGELDAFDLDGYDGVLAFGEVVREIYVARGWARRAWTWHEAADTALFRPRPEIPAERDLVWIGNWGDDERTAELREFLLEPAAALGLATTIHGVRYPDAALDEIARAGIAFRGWLANTDVPAVFARHHTTIHVPRQPYVRALPGIPTIRVFEALACGIPLVSAPWSDTEGLFRHGRDFLVVRDGAEMRRALAEMRDDPARRAEQAASGRDRILERHTCAHRVAELVDVVASIRGDRAASPSAGTHP